ncbi:hypothetical protein [Vreelandella aquamarina]|uniref:Uncharacterized protein n=1 Tax=Vreelandella aquamarina TaxID=77097 RepID=A0A857GIN7_9GAMM|nr:hypothetical protein [Halomonas meridiana]QHD49132.1 hypothetical protein CTT34_05200 [Halomonas meridiana]
MNVTPLPVRQTPRVQQDRAGFGALRAELHQRASDQDLVVVWSDLPFAERRLVLKSAGVAVDATLAISQLDKTERTAVRAAIHRMSEYASGLKDQLRNRKHPSAELASHARQAIAEGNTKAALHWLSLIEKGVA